MKRIGTQIRLKENERAEILADLNFWRDKSEEYFGDRAAWEEAFYCAWEGQHPSGLVIGNDEEQAWPFEGASDQRVRLGDKMFQKLYALIAVALSACTIEVTSVGKDAEKRAANIHVLLNWMLETMGAEGWGQIRALIHYFVVDSPAIAGIEVNWDKTWNLHPETITVEELTEEFTAWAVSTGGMAEAEAADYVGMCLRAAQEPGEAETDTEALEDFLVRVKGARVKDAKKIIKALATEEDEKCEFLSRGEADEGISLEALRYGDDFCIPVRCDNFKYANPWFRGEWVTEEQLRERIESDDWDPKWVEETLQHPGMDFYNAATPKAGITEDYKDLYNIAWAYMAETNERGETVRYETVLGHANGSAFGKRVISERRGKWPVVIFRREVLSTNIVEGRGLAEICCADQGLAKTIKDKANDAAIVGSLPPVITKGTKARNAVLEPFGKIPIGTSDDVRFMTPPQFPATANDREKKIEEDLMDYLGIANGENQVSERTKAFVRDVLMQFRDLFVMMVEVAQDNASDEVLAGVTDEGDVKGLRREDVQGRFGIMLKLDPDNLDHEKLMKRLTTFSEIIGMDKRQEVDTAPVLRHALFALFPEVSKKSIKTAEELQGEDIRNEQENFVKIKSGIMPEMNTEGGWNYAARLQWWQQMQEENPDAFAEMSPRSQEMMQQWLAALEQQNTQYGENREIGRTGVKGVGAE